MKNLSDSLFEKNITYIILIGLYALLLTMQINQPPCERYPGWDWFWVDTMNVGKLTSNFRHSIFSLNDHNICERTS